jgi:hypothetical protein
LYSDLETHVAEGRHALTLTQKRDIARWILFLKSDVAYAYPRRSAEWLALAAFIRPILSILSFGAFGRWLDSKNREFADAGDLAVWPFAYRGQLREEIRRVDRERAGTRRK